jgi:hypothetical protein
MTNISSLISPGLLQTLSSVGLPTAFGEQIKDKAKKKIISTSLNQINIIQDKIEGIIKKKLQLEKTHKVNLNKLDEQYNPKKPKTPIITKEEYDRNIIIENIRYEAEKKSLNDEQHSNENKIQSINKDPRKSLNLKIEKQRSKIKKLDSKNKANKTKSNKALLKSIGKSIAPIMMHSSIKIITKIAIQNSKLKELVDKTNEIIDSAITTDQIEQAKISRQSAYNILNNNEKEVINIQSTLNIISIILTVLSILSKSILLSISAPATPASFYEIYKKIDEKLSLLTAISLILSSVLSPILNELRDLKDSLKEIDKKLDLETIDSGLNINYDILDKNNQVKEEIYKGFKLVIKEDQNPQSFVRNTIKRHYGVAIDKDGVEAIKSEYSYTLEPQILIDQLKIKIDQLIP